MCFIQLIYDNSFHVSLNLLAFDGGMHFMQMHTNKCVCRQLWKHPYAGKLSLHHYGHSIISKRLNSQSAFSGEKNKI